MANRILGAPPRGSAEIIEGHPLRVIPPRMPDPMTPDECEDLLMRVYDGRRVQALGWRLLVRVGSPPEKSAGGIWYPVGTTGPRLYDDRMGSKVYIIGDVLSAGPNAHKRAKRLSRPFQPGDRIFFSRLNFGWLKRIEGEGEDRGDFIGFVDPQMIEALVEA